MSSADILQWLAILVSCVALIFSTIYSHLMVRAARIESELNAYFKCSDTYHQLLFGFLAEDGDVLKYTGPDLDRKMKFKMYQIIELFAEIYDMRKYQKELGQEAWVRWEQRMKLLMNKPAFRYAWENQTKVHGRIFSERFLNFVESEVFTEQHQEQ